MSTPPELKILLALDALIDVRAETLGDEERDRVNDAIDAVHKIIEPEEKLLAATETHHRDRDPRNNDPSNLELRLKIGTRVRATRFKAGCRGTVRGYYDPDLKLPLIMWDAPYNRIGLEACYPEEYEVI